MSKLIAKSRKQVFKLSFLALDSLSKKLEKHKSYKDKYNYLKNLDEAKPFLKLIEQVEESLSLKKLYLLLSLVVIDQSHVLSACLKNKKSLDGLLDVLEHLESFYNEVGGVIGYQKIALDLLCQHENENEPHQVSEKFYPPHGIDLRNSSKQRDEIVACGILAQDQMAEIYPVGGAADRLNLHDENTNLDLPAAKLEFLGRSLLEGLILDLQAREYLHYKVTTNQVVTPLALMTSKEKNNDVHIKAIFEENNFFGRDPSSVKFFSQPLVPTFTEDGKWCLKDSENLLCKPGGHGVIWKLAENEGVLNWILKEGKKKALIRQINNPVAGTDLGLLALSGYGVRSDKCFGFASCLRRVLTSEGINILKEKKTDQGYKIVLSNIEYCDFKKFNIEDVPGSLDSRYSAFPSNTNILFADIRSTQEAIQNCPFPGMLVNFKKMDHFENGQMVHNGVARVELLMQNIADGFEKIFDQSFEKDPHPDTRAFMTFNERRKTISPTKKQFVPGSGLVETAWGCFYDYLTNIWDLFVNYCDFDMPELGSEQDLLSGSLSFMVKYHPALGPLYSVIAKKLNKGSMKKGSELQLNIAEVEINNLDLDGSLCIHADQVMGHLEEGRLVYSDKVGMCKLKNVQVKNLGINANKETVFWKNNLDRKQCLNIHLKGQSLFVAEDVCFENDLEITVENGTYIKAFMKDGKLSFEQGVLTKPLLWNYSIQKNLLEIKR